jgi:predicted O-linked N-acetylglucosamine transferase (SPINDLY family)
MRVDPYESALEKHRRGDLESAQSGYAAVLAADPRHAGALMGMGLVAQARGDLEAAVSLLGQARDIAPRVPAVLNNYGLVLSAAGREDEAVTAWRRALTLEPRFADAHLNLGNAEARAGRREAAIRRYRAALAADPRSVGASANLGGLLLAMRAYTEAVHWLQHAAALDPRNADVHVNLGRAWSDCGFARRALSAFEAALRGRPGDRSAASNLLLALHYADDVEAAAIAQAHHAWARALEPSGPAPRPQARAEAGARLRVGLLSGDFNDHAVMRFLAPLLERHDPAALELRCYHTGPREDVVTAEARRWSNAFATVGGLDDAQLAGLLRGEELDVLVDLAGHSAHGRPRVLALRPAPLQVSWLGYLDTVGLAAVDYRITDGVADPPGLTDGLHVEKLWRLPSMWCYRPRRDAPAVASSPSATEGRITFGSTNNPAKLSDAALALWAGVLAAVPGSRLLVHAHDDPLCRDRLSGAFATRGIEAGRVRFFGREDAADYLLRYGQIDVLLDTTPYSGGTTTCDSLWMGVPVVTLAGDRPFSRTSASVLAAAGFPRWIASDRDGFVRTAAALAADAPALATLRETLRDRVAASRLCDERALVADFTAALRAMWADAGLPPRGDAR